MMRGSALISRPVRRETGSADCCVRVSGEAKSFLILRPCETKSSAAVENAVGVVNLAVPDEVNAVGGHAHILPSAKLVNQGSSAVKTLTPGKSKARF